MKITLKRSQANVKKPKHLQKMFLLFIHQGQLRSNRQAFKK